MSIQFPPPDATFEEVTAFYAEHRMPRPECTPYEPKPKSTVQWIEVDGATCEGPCRGWDGKSYRCDCGNNRVCWYDIGGTRYAGIC